MSGGGPEGGGGWTAHGDSTESKRKARDGKGGPGRAQAKCVRQMVDMAVD